MVYSGSNSTAKKLLTLAEDGRNDLPELGSILAVSTVPRLSCFIIVTSLHGERFFLFVDSTGFVRKRKCHNVVR